jgi:tetratricopeptide (TPR) repeat protein
MGVTNSGPLNLFISYAHEDEELCQKLLKHLSQLQRDGVKGWYDRRIAGGAEWAGEIDDHLNSADIILLLISVDFLASKYCYDVEMKRALERHDQTEDRARVVPIILRPCEWKESPFSRLNALPVAGKPVVDWPTVDHGLLSVVEGLRRVVEEVRMQASASPPAVAGATPAFREFPKARPLQRAGTVAAAILVVASGWLWWSKQQRYIAQGEASLDVGRYVEARQPFQQALLWNPLSSRAAHGLATARLYDLLTKPVQFSQSLNDLSKEAPNDPHLKILKGDYELAQDRRGEALEAYRKAAELSPHVAEAYHRMCFLLTWRATRAGPSSPARRRLSFRPCPPITALTSLRSFSGMVSMTRLSASTRRWSMDIRWRSWSKRT